MGNSIFDERFPLHGVAQILAADTTTLKQLVPGQGAGFSRIDNIFITNTDGIDHKVDFWLTVSAVNYLIGSIDAPAGTGKAGTPAVDAIVTLVAAGQQGLFLDTISALWFSVEVTVVTGAVQGVYQGGLF